MISIGPELVVILLLILLAAAVVPLDVVQGSPRLRLDGGVRTSTAMAPGPHRQGGRLLRLIEARW
jgi:hypothetical protein